MNKLLSIGEAAKMLSVSVSTLRRWEREGRITPASRTEGKQRRYDPFLLEPHRKREKPSSKKTVAYARVSSRDQKRDLERQSKVLEIITVFSARLYGSRSHKNKKLIEKLTEAATSC